ncbi:MAG TPA: MoxR family ATPase [Candidatus Kapabacteria bacterium]|nr:MoxR family ATPase [Candidatus Kapabacteria bacterium]
MNVNLDQLKQTLRDARAEISKVIIGQSQVIDLSLITIFTRSHALIEGVPGVAKTLLVRTLAAVLGGEFARIQFTPDLMPSDITGTNIFNLQKNEFTLVKGPIFISFLLADEINRAPAKTQSALLQAMQERNVTIDRDTHTLAPDFTVFATQNPVEYEGTYPLPEAQKDRFMLKITMNPPSREEEVDLAQRMLGEHSPELTLASGAVQAVLNPGTLSAAAAALEQVTVRQELGGYIVDLVRATRQSESVLVGGGPRATQALLLASRAQAVLDGRDFVTPDDIKSMAVPVLEHRVILRPEFEIEGLKITEVIERVFRDVAVPR